MSLVVSAVSAFVAASVGVPGRLPSRILLSLLRRAKRITRAAAFSARYALAFSVEAPASLFATAASRRAASPSSNAATSSAFTSSALRCTRRVAASIAVAAFCASR